MKTRFVFLVLIAVIFAGALLSAVWWKKSGTRDDIIRQNRKDQPSNSQKITLEIFHEPVTIKPTNGKERLGKSSNVLAQGDTVITGELGRAQIVYPNGTVTRLDKNTEIFLQSVEVSPQRVGIQVKKGQIWSRIAELLSDESYKTSSTNIAARVKGTSYGHSLLPNGADQIITTKGEVIGSCLNNSEESKISKDHKMIFTCSQNGKDTLSIIENKDKDEWYKFNNQEDDQLNQRFGPFVYKDNGEVLGINDIAENISDQTNAVINRLADNSNTSGGSNNSTTTTTNPTNTPVPVQQANTPTPAATSTPVPPRILGYIKPLASSLFGAVVTSNGTSKPATDGMVIYAGDKVETHGNTRVQIVMPPNSTTTCPDSPGGTAVCTYTRLDTNTSVQLNSNSSKQKFNADVVVEAGKIWNRIKKLTGQETYDTQSENDSGLVATVRGTSYGHSVGFEDNELTDRLYTIEGRVFARCKRTGLQGEVTADTPEKFRKFQCNKNSLIDFLQQLSSMDQSDIDWLVYNTNLDLPGDLAGNQPPTVTINTASADLPNNQNTINLDATVTDDGKPFGGTAMIWTINGLPCIGICDDPFSEKTKVTFPRTGIYTMQLTATDLSKSSSATVTFSVNVLNENKAPVPVAGPDKTITLPGKATLNGSVTDDGFPVKKFLVNWWTLVKGPASVSFSNAFSAQSVATFSKPGTYTLRLNSFDGDKQSFDDIIIVVLPVPPSPTPTSTPTPTPSPAAFIDISDDKKEATIRIENLFTLHSLLYSFSYDSAEGHKGVTGEKDPIENNRYEQMIPFGTCSTTECVYNTNVGNVILDIILKDASNADVQHLHAAALTSPTPTPTNTPTPSPTPSGPLVTGVTMTSTGCVFTFCNPTFVITGQNLISAASYTIFKGSTTKAGVLNMLVPNPKTNTGLNITFPLVRQNNGYQVKIHFSGGQDIILPGTFNL